MTPCAHGHAADPRMCPTCRRAPAPAEPEPLIRGVIHDVLGNALAPYLADHLTRRLFDELVASGLEIHRRPT
ncbi:hypothetical protein ACFFMN_33800 [Planobispora siamensis]|uniref:Uncharacterized protein n=1 Tax=Planobispora siamensis TaxID=936338 RepID=A0A8J3SH49_9ACTN|nr:hypothetical protein [Planobispora siamensis]GIH91974.1 hypothetical protein Psi01_26040 [Planobispora siamensis]